MAIDNLDAVCSKKPEGNQPGGLNYITGQIYGFGQNGFPKNEDFNRYLDREKIAQKQLIVIGRYLQDFKSIIKKFDEKEQGRNQPARGGAGGRDQEDFQSDEDDVV